MLRNSEVTVVALREGFFIEDKRFDLDTLRVPNRSLTPISKSNDFLRQSDDIWGARGTHFLPMCWGSRGPASQNQICSFFTNPSVA